MTPSATLAARGIRAAGVLHPTLGGMLAERAFFETRPRMPVHERDAATHSAARTGEVLVHGSAVRTYQWGSGDTAVLLLHGWRGRASAFATLVRELVADGRRVHAFDAPGHGASGGRRTDVRDWVETADRLQQRHGGFDALVGHSFGALAALTAARGSVPTPLVVTIAGAASPAAFVDQFAGDLRLTPASLAAMNRRFRARLDVDEQGMIDRYDAVADPLPADTELLVVHDRADTRMPDADALRLHDAHAGRSRLVRTDGFGHSRLLRADVVLDAIVERVRDAARRRLPHRQTDRGGR